MNDGVVTPKLFYFKAFGGFNFAEILLYMLVNGLVKHSSLNLVDNYVLYGGVNYGTYSLLDWGILHGRACQNPLNQSSG